jgi:hypothetical protein
MISPAPQLSPVPELSMPNARQLPSASLTKAGPPESPKHGALPMPPTCAPRPVSARFNVVSTQRLVPKPPLLSLLSPKPATTTFCPGLRMSTSQPISGGMIGTSVTGVRSLQNAKSVPSEPPVWKTRQYSIGTRRAGVRLVSPKVAMRWSVPQWAAVVTMKGWTSVPVHPESSTVVGHWQTVAFWPPTIGWLVVSCTGSARSTAQPPDHPSTATMSVSVDLFMSAPRDRYRQPPECSLLNADIETAPAVPGAARPRAQRRVTPRRE